LDDVIEHALKTNLVDPRRVFVVGYSNGGFMAHRLACDLSGRIAAVVSIAGAGPRPEEGCEPKVPVRVLQIHGDADDIVSYTGGRLFGKAEFPLHVSAPDTLSSWARRLGCAGAPSDGGRLDLSDKKWGAETRVLRHTECRSGAVELWTVAGGDHYVAMRAPAQELIWKFLMESGT
jgi:polyhydroxybutyrate depolymerase